MCSAVVMYKTILQRSGHKHTNMRTHGQFHWIVPTVACEAVNFSLGRSVLWFLVQIYLAEFVISLVDILFGGYGDTKTVPIALIFSKEISTWSTANWSASLAFNIAPQAVSSPPLYWANQYLSRLEHLIRINPPLLDRKSSLTGPRPSFRHARPNSSLSDLSSVDGSGAGSAGNAERKRQWSFSGKRNLEF